MGAHTDISFSFDLVGVLLSYITKKTIQVIIINTSKTARCKEIAIIQTDY